MESSESYVYKKEADWSLLTEGLAIPLENQVIFGRNMGKFLTRGETKEITLFLDGRGYPAQIKNLNLAARHNRITDILQIRYSSNSDLRDPGAGVFESPKIIKIRKLNRKIGDNLKLLYDYRCQICGRRVGDEYGTHATQAHHIDYFVRSLDNSASNQLIVCPDHHTIIHNTDPAFDLPAKIYTYPNGFTERLQLNLHL